MKSFYSLVLFQMFAIYKIRLEYIPFYMKIIHRFSCLSQLWRHKSRKQDIFFSLEFVILRNFVLHFRLRTIETLTLMLSSSQAIQRELFEVQLYHFCCLVQKREMFFFSLFSISRQDVSVQRYYVLLLWFLRIFSPVLRGPTERNLKMQISMRGRTRLT